VCPDRALKSTDGGEEMKKFIVSRRGAQRKLSRPAGVFFLLCIFLTATSAKPTKDPKPTSKPKVLNVEKEPRKIKVEPEGKTNSPAHTEAQVKVSHPSLESFAIKGESFLIPSENIHAGNTIKYIVQVSWEGKLGDIEVDEPEPPLLTNLRLVKVVPSNKVSPETNRAIAEFAYYLKGLEKGKAYIGIIDARYRLKDGSGSSSFRLKEQRFDILAPQHNLVKNILYVLGICVGIFIVAGVVIAVIRFLKRPPIAPPAQEEATTPYERIQGELSSMRLFLVEGETLDFYSKLAKLVRGFVAITEGNDVLKMTTDELLSSLQERNYNPENRDRVFSILEICDRVRFAGHVPSADENNQVLKDFETLLRAPH